METPIDPKHIGCLNCGGNKKIAPLDKVIAVGFGAAYASKDGVQVYSEPQDDAPESAYKTFADIEALAIVDPDHDWQVVMDAPLKMGRWQRHSLGQWVLVEEGPGFA